MMMMVTKIEKTSNENIDVEHGMYLAVSTLKNHILRVNIKSNLKKLVIRIYFLNMGCT